MHRHRQVTRVGRGAPCAQAEAFGASGQRISFLCSFIMCVSFLQGIRKSVEGPGFGVASSSPGIQAACSEGSTRPTALISDVLATYFTAGSYRLVLVHLGALYFRSKQRPRVLDLHAVNRSLLDPDRTDFDGF